ncbi:hypothetical protein PUN28_009241 [Cardiocondyla obscurior]|uniref:Uncharacterized protein n=1 Tax=Cardiocondyla obscurior TaxID=286306 RepID=A0AAW2FT91_9HYME
MISRGILTRDEIKLPRLTYTLSLYLSTSPSFSLFLSLLTPRLSHLEPSNDFAELIYISPSGFPLHSLLYSHPSLSSHYRSLGSNFDTISIQHTHVHMRVINRTCKSTRASGTVLSY